MMENLKIARKRRGFSQSDLAKGLGLSQQAINKYENGTAEPDLATLVKIAEYLDVSVDYLIGNESNEAPLYSIDERIAFVMEKFLNLDAEGQDVITLTIKALGKK